MTIAIDAMGGDLFPKNPVLGAIKAVSEKNISVILVGDEASIKNELDGLQYNHQKVEIVHAAYLPAYAPRPDMKTTGCSY